MSTRFDIRFDSYKNATSIFSFILLWDISTNLIIITYFGLRSILLKIYLYESDNFSIYLMSFTILSKHQKYIFKIHFFLFPYHIHYIFRLNTVGNSVKNSHLLCNGFQTQHLQSFFTKRSIRQLFPWINSKKRNSRHVHRPH